MLAAARRSDRHASRAARTLVLVAASVLALTGRADEPVGDDRAFAAGLTAFAAECDAAGDAGLAAEVRRHAVLRRSDRLELFLPPTDPPAGRDRTTAPAARWQALRRARADALLTVAATEAAAGRADVAVRRLYEAVWIDPDHATAREMLGFRPDVRGGWTRGEKDARVETRRSRHGDYGWAAGTHHRIESPHFKIDTNTSAADGRALAGTLERALELWRQVYVWRWDRRGEVADAIVRRRPLPFPRVVHDVTLFADREEYLARLAKDVRGIDRSVAIYSDVKRTMFLAGGTATPEATATTYHEACHQFFQEDGESAPAIGREANVWAIEAVAIAFESVRPEGGYFVVGGFDAPRLQVARYRRYLLQQWIPPTELAALGLETLREAEDLPLVYAQAGGMAQLILAPRTRAEVRDRFARYVQAVYAGRDRGSSWAEVGLDDETLLAGYDRLLAVTDADLADLAAADRPVRELVLARTAVTDAGLARLPGAGALTWLDLSFTATDGSGLVRLPELEALERLSLEGTRITDATLAALLPRCPALTELDLSGTAVTDAGLPAVRSRGRLRSLWLTGTGVTGDGLARLTSLGELTHLDVGGTRVAPADWARLRPSWPKLETP